MVARHLAAGEDDAHRECLVAVGRRLGGRHREQVVALKGHRRHEADGRRLRRGQREALHELVEGVAAVRRQLLVLYGAYLVI